MNQRNPSERRFWWLDALCRGLDPNIWFPDRPQGRDYFAIARSYCDRCSVSAECLADALTHDADNDRFGMFGGKSPRERMVLRGDIPPQKDILEPKPIRPRKIKPQPPVVDTGRTKAIIRAYEAQNKPDWVALAIRKKPINLESTNIPKATQLLMNVTPTLGASQLTAQASAAMIMAGWEDPMTPRTAAALFMGASYVGNLAHEGVAAGVITPEESAAIQGVVELAMQVWKFHAVNGKIDGNV